MPLSGRLSVVICTKNRPARVASAVVGLAAQARRPDEVLIVDQSQGDEGRRLVEALSSPFDLHYILDPTVLGAAAARNVGLRLAKSDVIAFLDDDVKLSPDALALLESTLRSKQELAAVSGIVVNYQRPSPFHRAWRRVFFLGPLYDERQPIYWSARAYAAGYLVPTTKLCGGCMMFRRAELNAIGGFDPRYRGSSVGEDIEVSQRLLHEMPGRGLAFVAGAWVENTVKGEWRSREDLEATALVSLHYLQTREAAASSGRRLRFAVALTGMSLMASLASMRRLNLGPVRSLVRGIHCISAGYRGADFLVPVGVPLEQPAPTATGDDDGRW
jgi:glycosyltransferase involved in cell wall biosynthesis